MLQRRLQVLVGIRRGQPRVAVAVRIAAAVEEVVVVERLAQREVAHRGARRVADDAGILLGDVARGDPRLDRVLAGGPDQVVQLLAGGGGALRLAALDVDAPAADPGHVAAQGEVDGRIDAARVEGCRALAFLELPERDLVRLVAVAAARDGAVIERERLADHQVRIDRAERDLGLERLDGRLHLGRVGRAIAPAVVELVAQADDEARVVGIVEIDLRLGGVVGRQQIVIGEERLLRHDRRRTVAGDAIVLDDRIDRGAVERRVGRERAARADVLDHRRAGSGSAGRRRCRMRWPSSRSRS